VVILGENTLDCTRYVPQMTLNLGNYMLTDDFYAVKIPDTNVVLGVQWLYSLGRYSTNYQTMEMEFQDQDGKRVVLRGMNTYPPKVVTAKKMEVVMRRNDIARVVEFHISVQRTKGGEPNCPREIHDLFQGHDVFGNVPSGRPPGRGFEHISELEEGTRAVITPSYRHPRAYREELEKHLQECGVFQRDEVEHTQSAGSLQPLPIHDQEWESISMASITRLLKMQGKDCINVQVDRLTKFAHYSTIPLDYSAAQVIELYFREMFRLHGWAKAIVSSRDDRFTGSFWQVFSRLVCTKLTSSTSYHP
jgi:hypothetical protein